MLQEELKYFFRICKISIYLLIFFGVLLGNFQFFWVSWVVKFRLNLFLKHIKIFEVLQNFASCRQNFAKLQKFLDRGGQVFLQIWTVHFLTLTDLGKNWWKLEIRAIEKVRYDLKSYYHEMALKNLDFNSWMRHKLEQRLQNRTDYQRMPSFRFKLGQMTPWLEVLDPNLVCSVQACNTVRNPRHKHFTLVRCQSFLTWCKLQLVWKLIIHTLILFCQTLNIQNFWLYFGHSFS